MRPTPRPRRRHAAFAFLLLAFWLALWPGPTAAENQAESLREDLTSEKARADQAKSALGQLTEKERTLFSRLAGLEDQVGRMTKTVMAQEAALAKAEAEEERIRARYAVLAAERDQAFAALSDLLALTWPVHRENLENRLGGMSSWQSADRRFTWLAAVYKAVRQGLVRLREQSAALAANLAEQERLGAEAREKLNAVNASKDDLLSSKLSLAKSIREIRAERVSREEELAGTLAAIDSLKYRLTNLTDRRFEGFKGALPWPAAGRLVESFAPAAEPPRRGIGLSLPEGTPVKCVSWGKVVHADLLRGFGTVVIVYHGDDYYSLYAFLTKAQVRNGQEVEKDEVIGSAGYFPEARGPGLYFELRFGQKPINPMDWLSAKR
jgi:septal ring factor EnvC (AmiA/AmiB activator)